MQAEVFGSKQEEVVRRRQVKKSGRFKMLDQLALQSMVMPSVIFGDSILVQIQDDGKGMSHNELMHLNHALTTEALLDQDTSENIGLRNINKRLMLFYTQEQGLYIESLLGEGTIVSFEIRKHT